ncbi:hypothetical protein VM636_21900 [Streptomyces sp. SCSIO 75703]|uniref:hypothetical protein n=1 Tax=unclassified Streptomyces TaxID=2593676 RepID=UPI00131C2EC3|nr:hypothetical protein [Streptomyces sp. TP-A0875]
MAENVGDPLADRTRKMPFSHGKAAKIEQHPKPSEMNLCAVLKSHCSSNGQSTKVLHALGRWGGGEASVFLFPGGFFLHAALTFLHAHFPLPGDSHRITVHTVTRNWEG